MSFTRLLHDRCKRPMDEEEQRLCYKAEGREFAAERGVPVAEMIQDRTPLEGLREPEVDRFVIKPNRGCTARAIIVAERIAPDLIRNHLGQNVHGWDDSRTWDQWASWLRWCMRRDAGSPGPYPDEWVVEAWASDDPQPMEYGVYCVGGHAQFVRQVDRGGHRPGPRARVCNWTRDWEPAGGVLKSRKREVPLPLPDHPVSIVQYAEWLARDWPGPFVRVDFLEAAHGPVFLELTPRPAGGRITVNEPWDTIMGEAWEEWEAAHTVEV
jgi:hypothetical protein